MSTRRDFLNFAVKGSAMAATAAVLPGGVSTQVNRRDSRSTNNMEGKANGSSNVHYKPPFTFGLGGVPLGNEFAVVTDKDANAILEAAWSAGIRYYDVSPWYGLGLAERRYGNFLHNKQRSEYVVSSKVGKLLKASKTAKNREMFPFSPSPNDVIFDYTASGVRRSIEDSLQRLGIDSLDIVFVHDISSDNKLLPTSWQEQFDIATKGAFPELTRMREEGLIKGWGIGVNTPEPILRVLKEADPDVCLMASQYSLVDHKNALNQLFPAVRNKNASLVVGSSLNAGFISGSPRYNYGKDSYKIPTQFLETRKQLREVAANHGVDLRTAALQFSASPDVAAALVVGASSEQQILADYTSMETKIPAEFWAELKTRKLIEQNAPTPA
ncbi:MAG TPA: aldo/keto reductase [Candidatus Acidoferrales bacterium]|jgi:D-threo-aldose 1-dehydrogenase|nr:aldo/keto reductase [Candidatus Acidoferrales bacterium]